MALAVLVLTAILTVSVPAWAEPKEGSVDEAMQRMKEAIPRIVRILEIFSQEAPRLLATMERSARQAGAGETMPLPKQDSSGVPSAQTVAERFRRLESMLNVVKESQQILMRLRRSLEEKRE